MSTDSSFGPSDSGTLGSLRRIPIEADLLVAYAVQPGKFSGQIKCAEMSSRFGQE